MSRSSCSGFGDGDVISGNANTPNCKHTAPSQPWLRLAPYQRLYNRFLRPTSQIDWSYLDVPETRIFIAHRHRLSFRGQRYLPLTLSGSILPVNALGAMVRLAPHLQAPITNLVGALGLIMKYLCPVSSAIILRFSPSCHSPVSVNQAHRLIG